MITQSNVKITIGKLSGLNINNSSIQKLRCFVYCSAWGSKHQKTEAYKNNSSIDFNTTFQIPISNINDDIIKIKIVNDSQPSQKLFTISIKADQIPIGECHKIFNLNPTENSESKCLININFIRDDINSYKLETQNQTDNILTDPSSELPRLQRETDPENLSLLNSNTKTAKEKGKNIFDEIMHIFYFVLIIFFYEKIIFKSNFLSFPSSISFFDYIFSFKVFDPYDPNVLVVSAYFPLSKSKYSQNEYDNWIRSFLKIINSRAIIYTTPSFYDSYYKAEIKNIPINRRPLFNFNLTFNNIYEVPCVQNLSNVFQKMHDLDREKAIHNSDLYAIWNSKLYFMREATFIYPNYSLYFWVDSGVVRYQTYTELYDENGNVCKQSNSPDVTCFNLGFPGPNFTSMILSSYSNPPLEFCLFFVSFYSFQKHSTKKVTDDVAQGCFFGSKSGILKFYDAFWETNDLWIKNNMFIGKEQDTFNYIFANYYDKINFYIFPAYSAFNQNGMTRMQKIRFRWFVFLSAFSRENPYHVKNDLLPGYTFLK